MDNTGFADGGPRQAAGFPIFGLAASAVCLMLAALAVAERAGLPGTLAWPLGFVAILGGVIAVIAAVRTGVERVFLGRVLLVRPAAGGALLGVFAAAACHHLIRPATSHALVAMALGAAAGIAAAHVLARRRAGSTLLVGEAAQGEDGAPSLIQGLLIAAAGLLLALAALPAARDAVSALTGWPASSAGLVVVALPLAALAAAGLRGLLGLGAALGLSIAAGIGLTLWLGQTQLGSLPLPGFTQQDTLLAIAGARTRLFTADALPFLISWVPPEGFAALILSLPFLAAFATAALLGRAAAPGLPLESGSAGLAAVLTVGGVLFGLACMAGYAVEAAGLQFVGASLQTPPPGLLEASRQGIAEFCGQRPDTLDALRAACGLAPRALGQLPLERVRLLEPFLWTGVPVSLGLPTALAAPARLGPLAFPLLAITAGLWLLALGLGRGVLGRGRIAPGLASHRLGLLRLAAIVGACAVLFLPQAPTSGGWWQPAVVVALLALGLDLVQQGIRPPAAAPVPGAVQRAATSRKSAAPRTTAQSA